MATWKRTDTGGYRSGDYKVIRFDPCDTSDGKVQWWLMERDEWVETFSTLREAKEYAENRKAGA